MAPSRKRSKIWIRTMAYLGVMLVIFCASVLSLSWFTGLKETQTRLMVRVATERLGDRQKFLDSVPATDGGKTFGWLKKQRQQVRADLERLKAYKRIFREPKSKKNEQALLDSRAEIENLARKHGFAKAIAGALESFYQKMIWVVVLFFVAISLVVIVLFRLILVPLEEIIRGAEKVSTGNLNVNFNIRSGDELASLATVLQNLTANFNELLVLMRSTSRNGLAATDRLKENLGTTPEAGEKLAASQAELEETFRKLEEITEYFSFRG